MRSRLRGKESWLTVLRGNKLWLAGAGLGLALFSYLTLVGRTWPDYNGEAQPAVEALVHGHLTRFLQLAPAYGGSLLLRAPFILVARALGGGEAWMFRASTVPGLLGTAALGIWLGRRATRRGAPWMVGLVVLALCVLNPMSVQAVQMGHPEEVLGAVLCIAAVLAAMHDRPGWAGLLLGMAIANKEWAVLAAGPVLVALPTRRLRCVICAVAVAVPLTAPFLIAGATGLDHGINAAASSTGNLFTRWQLWWFLGAPGHLYAHVNAGLVIAYRAVPPWLQSVSHPLIAVIWVPATLLYVAARWGSRREAPGDPLLLLVLLLLLRCALDPWDTSYYSLPFLLGLVSWEAVRRSPVLRRSPAVRRSPVFSVSATLLAWLVFVESAEPALGLSTDAQALIFLVVVVPALLVLATAVYAPHLMQWLGRGLRGDEALAAAA